jgi:hypothetical protein
MKACALSPVLTTLASLTIFAGVARAADYPKEILADNPLLYYRFNDPAPVDAAFNRGIAGLSANGAYLGGVTHRVPGALAGSGSGAAEYLGNGGRTSVPFIPELNPPAASPFTIEAWVKPTIEGAGNAQCPLFNRHSTGNRQGWVFFQRPSAQGFNFRMYDQNGSTQSVDLTGGPYTIGEWSHLVAVWNGSSATLYVNGVSVGSQAAGYVANTDAPLGIGAYSADNPGDNAFTGSLDEVAFYNTALTSATILAHYTNGTSAQRTQPYSELVAASAPVLYLHLDEPAPDADVAANSGSLGPAGDALNFPGQKRGRPGALAASGDTATGYSAIDPLSCDGGVPTHVPFKPELNTAVFSVEAWLRPVINGTSNAQCPLYNRKEGDVRTGWAFFQRDAATGWNFRMYNGINADRSIDITSDIGYTVGEWVHLAATFDGFTGVLYVNGVARGTQTATGAYAPNTDTVEFSAGGFPNGIENPFTGDIDEVALYPSVLTAAQIMEHYQNGLDPGRTRSYESLVLSDGAVEYLRLNGPAYRPAANSGSLGAEADAAYVNTLNTGTGPQAPDYTGFETGNPAAVFNTNTYIELGNPAALNSAGIDFAGSISVEAWVTLNDPEPDDARIVSHGANDDTSPAEVSLRIKGGNYEFGSLNARASFTASPDTSTGAAVHLAGTYDGTSWNLFRNGVLVASTADPIGVTPVANANWAVGARGRWKRAAGYPASGQEAVFNGTIDEVAIYRQALSPNRVAAHYITGLAGAAPLQITRTGAIATLTWQKGTLQQSDGLSGFTDLPGAVSPYPIPPGSPRKYYRLRF